MCSNWETKGYFFENFDPIHGKGKYNRLFTGWTALISLIINESY